MHSMLSSCPGIITGTTNVVAGAFVVVVVEVEDDEVLEVGADVWVVVVLWVWSWMQPDKMIRKATNEVSTAIGLHM